jgi:hypothetical protein
VVLAAASFPLVGLSNGASAKPHPAATPQILIRCSPNPVVETGTSDVAVVCQVEANPSFAGKTVTISSTQLASRCTGVKLLGAGGFIFTISSATITLDNDGNTQVYFMNLDCAPGSALVTADVDSPPFATAVTKLVISPPQVTPAGVKAFPNPDVEVGDGAPIAPGSTLDNNPSEADFVFMVETNPVYAEQSVSLSSDQLAVRCGGGSDIFWFTPTTIHGQFVPPTPGQVFVNGGGTGVGLDNDGNAVFVWTLASCAAGKSVVIAEIGGGGPTYSSQVAILPPAVTI